jgi:hypothetical protein
MITQASFTEFTEFSELKEEERTTPSAEAAATPPFPRREAKS